MTHPVKSSSPRLFAGAGLLAIAVWAGQLQKEPRVGDDVTGQISHAAGAGALSRALRFEDRQDGGIRVIDTLTSTEIDTLAPGTNGFARGVLRALARVRTQHSVGAAPTFVLSKEVDRQLLLLDPQTGERVALLAFGHTNADAFERLLKLP